MTNAAPTKTKDAGDNLSAGKRTGPEQSMGVPAASVDRPVPSRPKAGSLQVFEKGKEIFHLPPEPEREQGQGSDSGAATLEDPSPKRAAIYELPLAAVSGSLLHRVEPEYPEEALAQRIQGPVTLDVRIAPDGTVETVNSVNGQRLLADAAIAAVRQWRFKPHVSNGQAVEMQTRVILNFRLPQ
jgi:TonB family protein